MGSDLKPANIIWRMAVGAVDGTLTNSMSLGLAWALGFLPAATAAAAGSGAVLAFARTPQMATFAANVGAMLAVRALVVFLYDTASVASGGQTVACRLLRLRIVAADGSRVPLRNAVKRAVAGGLVANTPVVGQAVRVGDYAASLFGKRRQAVRDRVAGTMLVHAPRARRVVADEPCPSGASI